MFHITKWPLWGMGFRPFFLLGSLYAVYLILRWMGLYMVRWPPPNYFDSVSWHAHEMLFGFVTSIIAGFLLTASARWTNTRGLHGSKLLLLVVIWCLGRVVMVTNLFTPIFVAAIDLLFLPALILCLAPILIRAKAYANTLFLLWLGLLFVANLLMHFQVLGILDITPRKGFLLAVNTILILMIMIGGRIIPLFTSNAVPDAHVKKWPSIEMTSILSAVLYLLCNLVLGESSITGFMALVAAGANEIRRRGWAFYKVLHSPILWILHIGYFWIVMGLFLRGISLAIWPLPTAIPIHALTAGAMSVLILGMLSRVALGHTGRPLRIPRPIVVAYFAINLSVIIRLLAQIDPLLPYYPLTITASGTLWGLSFLLYVVTYWPILTRPRVDGKIG